MKIDWLTDLILYVFRGKPSPLSEYSAEVSDAYDVRSRWDSKIPFADDNGIYFYIGPDGIVLYVGKADRSDGGGIGTEASRWVQPYNPVGAVMFPQHHWCNDPEVEDSVKSCIANGNFSIVTVKVEPSSIARYLEHLMILTCKMIDGDRPALNKRD